MDELSQEEVFADDKDPLEAIVAIRKEEDKNANTEQLEEAIEENSSATTEKAVEELPDELDEPNKEVKDPDSGTEELSAGDADDGLSEDPVKETDKAVEPVAELLKFKANGQDFEFTPEEVQSQFETVFGQAMDYTKKLQHIAPYRKMISALEDEGITQESLNTAIDALKGDKGAIQKILELNSIDSFDVSENEDGYTPTDYGKNEGQLALQEITGNMEADPEYPITVDVIDNQWDQESRQALSNNPAMIQGLHNDIKSGVYDKVAPMATKLRISDGNTKSNLEYYMQAGAEFQRQQASTKSEKKVDELNKPANDAKSQFDKASSEAEKKRAAASTGSRAGRPGVIDYLDDDNDEAFNAWYKKTMAG